jgi:hypothetical protein
MSLTMIIKVVQNGQITLKEIAVVEQGVHVRCFEHLALRH